MCKFGCSMLVEPARSKYGSLVYLKPRVLELSEGEFAM